MTLLLDPEGKLLASHTAAGGGGGGGLLKLLAGHRSRRHRQERRRLPSRPIGSGAPHIIAFDTIQPLQVDARHDRGNVGGRRRAPLSASWIAAPRSPPSPRSPRTPSFPRVLEAWAPDAGHGSTPRGDRAPSTPHAGAQLAALVDAILPDTDTPGARAAGVHVFVDLAVAECLPPDEREAFRSGLAALEPPAGAATASACGGDAGRGDGRCCATRRRRRTPFVKALKSLTVLGYGTSRIGATQALADDQVPGRYRGCVDLAPGPAHLGRAMTTRAQASHTYDAIVVGSGISGGWAAKMLTEGGLRTLVLERGRHVEHVKDYPTANLAPWELPHGNRATAQDVADSPVQSKLYLYGQDSKHFLVKDVEHPTTRSSRSSGSAAITSADARCCGRGIASAGATSTSPPTPARASASTGRSATRTSRRGTTWSSASSASAARTPACRSCPTGSSCRRSR